MTVPPEVSIVIPVKDPPNIDTFIVANRELLAQCNVIVIDSGGGHRLKPHSNSYEEASLSLWQARRRGYDLVHTKYILNLDADVIPPPRYVPRCLKKLEGTEKAGAVSIFYVDVGHCQGALEFGTSVWYASVLKKLYDFTIQKTISPGIIKVGEHVYSSLVHGWCECTYMWRKLGLAGLKLETLDGPSVNRAVHLHKAR